MASESGPSRSPLQGYNHNIRYGSRVYHVQTEDSGVDHPHLFTHLFHSGVIIATARTDYSELAPQAGHEPKVRKLMQTQHKRLMKELRGGQYDDKITALLGVDEELEARKAGKQEEAPAPDKAAAPPPSTSAAPARPPKPQTGHLPRDTERAPAPPSPAPPSPAPLSSAPLSSAPLSSAPLSSAPLSSAPLSSAPPSSAPLSSAPPVPSLADAAPGAEPEIPALSASAPDLQTTPHPVATSVEPELQARLDADDARTLRMSVRSEWDEGSETAPEAVPHVIIDQPIESHIPDRPGQPRRDADALRRRPTGSTPQRYTAPAGHRADHIGTAAPPPRQPRATGSYGSSEQAARGQRPVVGRTAGDRSESGVYQITLGGARPVSSKGRSAPRVLARPAVIVDRAPGRASSPGSTLQKVLSGMGTPTGEQPAQPRAEKQAPAGRPRSKTRAMHNLFGSDLISERSLDEVILQYLSEDQEQ